MNTLLGSLTLVEEVCCVCYTHFAMDRALYKQRQESGGLFYCPNGHSQHYRETELTTLKKQNQRLKADLSWTEQAYSNQYEETIQAKKEKAVIKGQLTKTRKRIANGVCPCCHRTFVNVSRHMTTQHPDFKQAVE